MNQKIQLVQLRSEQIKQYKLEMQEAFQQGAAEGFGKEPAGEILPESHIDRSLNTAGAVAYEALSDGERVGGAILVIDEEARHNYLDFLYVRKGIQSHGVGQNIWREIEALYPETEIWETCTPYFEKRNLHFYINKCGFHVVEFFNRFHTNPEDPDGESDEGSEEFEGMFRFEKRRKPF